MLICFSVLSLAFTALVTVLPTASASSLRVGLCGTPSTASHYAIVNSTEFDATQIAHRLRHGSDENCPVIACFWFEFNRENAAILSDASEDDVFHSENACFVHSELMAFLSGSEAMESDGICPTNHQVHNAFDVYHVCVAQCPWCNAADSSAPMDEWLSLALLKEGYRDGRSTHDGVSTRIKKGITRGRVLSASVALALLCTVSVGALMCFRNRKAPLKRSDSQRLEVETADAIQQVFAEIKTRFIIGDMGDDEHYDSDAEEDSDDAQYVIGTANNNSAASGRSLGNSSLRRRSCEWMDTSSDEEPSLGFGNVLTRVTSDFVSGVVVHHSDVEDSGDSQRMHASDDEFTRLGIIEDGNDAMHMQNMAHASDGVHELGIEGGVDRMQSLPVGLRKALRVSEVECSKSLMHDGMITKTIPLAMGPPKI